MRDLPEAKMGKRDNARASVLKLTFALATNPDAPALATLHNLVGEELTRRFGEGMWSWRHTERGVLANLRKPKFSKILTACADGKIVGSLRLATKKPWAIDVSYFTEVERPLYLTGMAVHPELQGKGVGRRLLKEAEKLGRDWPGDAIRLNAFDAAVGAGAFYAKNGYRQVARVKYKGDPLIYFELLLA